jgi:ArsR family transcriptional regulator, lead/cadmium/zinc/bismuth-responsive transcriptional repressor
MPKAIDPSCAPQDHLSRQQTALVQPGAIERAAGIFRAMGDGPRLRLLTLLGQGEACVTEMATAEGEDLSTISQRLRVLRNEGLVSRRRNGKHILYGLADQHVVDLLFNALAHASEGPPDLSRFRSLTISKD